MRLFGTVTGEIGAADAAAWLWTPFTVSVPEYHIAGYCIAASQVFSPGMTGGQVFSPGMVAGQLFTPGMIVGEVE